MEKLFIEHGDNFGVRYPESFEFVQFGVGHSIFIVLAFVAMILMVVFRRRLGALEQRSGFRFDILFTAALIVTHMSFVVYSIVTGFGGLEILLPLHTCEAAMFIAIWYCITKNQLAAEILLYWLYLGGFITIFMPDTFGYNFTHVLPVESMIYHSLQILFCTYLLLIVRVPLKLRSFLVPLIAADILAPFSMIANLNLGSDYLYLGSEVGGVFSFIGALPFGIQRIAVMELTAGAVFFAMFWIMKGAQKLLKN
jgi:hypothetical integral membrane protein (TIGR02206 family)